MKKISCCRFCGSTLTGVINLGHHPHSDFFPTDIDQSVSTYPLALSFCGNCTLYQLDHDLETNMMFNDEYLYDSSANISMLGHWDKLAEHAASFFDFTFDNQITALDVGSNSGEFVNALSSHGFSSVGVEPSLQPHLIALRQGRISFNALFDRSFAVENKNRYDLVSFTNSFPHIPNPRETIENALMCLKEDGICLIESPYSISMIESGQYDQIYHQHMTYLNATSINKLASDFGCSLVSCMHSDAQNGSLTYFISKRPLASFENSNVHAVLSKEANYFRNYQHQNKLFIDRIYKNRHTLRAVVDAANQNDQPVFCITAPAKGNTILNFCGLNSNDILYATEKNSLKIGRFTPCTNIPIVSDDHIPRQSSGLGIVLGWNLFHYIKNKFKASSINLVSPINTYQQ